jgi:hypothetical protein
MAGARPVRETAAMKRFVLTATIACLSLCVAAPSSAQPQPPDLTRFRAFADGLIGTWNVRIRDIDEYGKVIWDDASQKRTFSYTIGNEFLQEQATIRARRLGRDVVTGLHLFSYDPAGNRLTQHGYWPGKSGLMFTADVRLADDNRSAAGIISMPQDRGLRSERRLEIKWISDRELSYRAYAKDKSGREFLNEELVYTKAS